jgi:hypothetical protein
LIELTTSHGLTNQGLLQLALLAILTLACSITRISLQEYKNIEKRKKKKLKKKKKKKKKKKLVAYCSGNLSQQQ